MSDKDFDKVIRPGCCHQFCAVPENVQNALRAAAEAQVAALREALDEHVRAAECIRHWHDTLGGEGMVVSAEHVRLLWEATKRARAAPSNLPAPAPDRDLPTFRHKKRGTLYTVIGPARLQTDQPLADMADLVVYRSHEGELWVRPTTEFSDGRFEQIAPAPKGDDDE